MAPPSRIGFALRRLSGMPRPTVRLVVTILLMLPAVLVAADAGSELIAAAIVAVGLAALWGLLSSLAITCARLRGISRQKRPRRRTPRALADAWRALLPQTVSCRRTYDQLDQDGCVIRSISAFPEPGERGVYRLREERETHLDVFGLWSTRVRSDRASETVVPPAPIPIGDAEQGTRLAGGAEPQRDEGRIRPWTQGDPIHSISWRQSAHHGRLMSFDTRGVEGVQPLVVVDAVSPGAGDERAGAALGLFLALHAHGLHPQLTDGVHRCSTVEGAERLTAALRGGKGGIEERVARVRELARASTPGARRETRGPGVVLITPHGEGRLPCALAARSLATPLETVVIPEANHRAPTRPAQSLQAPPPHQLRARTVASGLACGALLVLALTWLTSLLDAGTWLPFGIIALGGAGAVSPALDALPRRAHRILVLIALSIALSIAGVIVAHGIVHDAIQEVIGSTEAVAATPDASILALTGGPDPLWLHACLARGYSELYFGQWVPLSLSPASDAAVVLTLAGAAAALSWLLRVRWSRALACLPALAVEATSSLLLGRAASARGVLLWLALTLLLLSLTRRASLASAGPDPRAHRAAGLPAMLATACLAIALAVASQALGPSALARARSLPVRLGLSSALAGANRVSPLIDLRRDLVQGPTAVALTYSSADDEPFYLRLTVLDRFDGDAWNLARPLSGQPDGLLGAVLAPRTARLMSTDLSVFGGEPRALSTPADLVMESQDLGASAGPLRRLSATVRIQGLDAHQAPAPVGTSSVTGAGGLPERVDWLWRRGEVIAAATSRTLPGMTYQANATYLKPITPSSDLASYASLPDQLHRLGQITMMDDAGSPADVFSLIEDPATERYTPTSELTELPEALPARIQGALERARAAGIEGPPTEAEGATVAEAFARELAAVRWLVAFFSDDTWSYDTAAPDGGGQGGLKAVDAFLDSRRGYCVHYASAATVLARGLGIPARLVIGYRPSNARAEDGSFAVTNRDLHAWTECHLAGVGWIGVDVTPPSRSDGEAAPAALPVPIPFGDTAPDDGGEAAPQRDAGATDGTEGHDQRPPENPLAAAVGRLSEIAERAAGWIVLALAALALLAGPILVRRIRLACRLHAAARGGVKGAEAAWAALLETAGRRGVAWDASTTESGRADAVIRALEGDPELASCVIAIADAVCRARYQREPGSIPPLGAALARVLDALASLPRR